MSSPKPYLNFDLQLSGEKTNFHAKVVNSPAGQASLDFVLPFSSTGLKNFILSTSQNRINARSLSLEPVVFMSVETLGRDLFDCLFTGDIAQCFHTSLAIARNKGASLHIRLSCSDAPTLINVPWELLFDSDNKQYIGLSNQTPIIRRLDLPYLPSIQQVDGCLQVLVMISSPKDHVSLDVEQEWERIDEATKDLQKANRIHLTRVEPSLLALQQVLSKSEFHVFQYIGHGGFNQNNNDGVLILEDSDKKGHLVNGQDLGTLLHDESSLQLVLLNSCKGGRTSVTAPFAGVGQGLLQKGIPAVIAMQFEITDKAAITFSSGFYGALVQGYSIETAVAEARKMIYVGGNKLEWATPVLYTSVEASSLINKPKMTQDPSSKRPSDRILMWYSLVALVLLILLLIFNF